ncbi:DNA repair protein RecO [Luteimonas wenzhouensis]|uniref:DNA repair protein RecO n=1 Tax=Luteimonas wenzhouensis TaxID=2599615 RepID=A0A5C5U303_9GAMM|nr:DNA repair protein RecO [Luteimonas wenzhouensis]NLW95567.1 DNA repair protein RecO [Xanthomonadaceae bacterium]TWT20811.1 DNA repair protein RecO [Luteimonas wenzhouensis]
MRYAGETAYVLHARPWRESSLLVDLLTRAHGRIGMIARGVRGPRRQAQLAALQPLQHVRFDGVQRGELGYLSSVEALDAPPLLAGHASLAAFYVNELVLRLAPGHDPHPELYALYAQVRARLHDAADLAWTLRRFERDLLQALGVGFDPGVDGDGAPIDPAARYRLEAEHGPRRVLGERSGESRQRHATGRALLALAADVRPDPEDLDSLRLAMRTVIAQHVGPRGLRSWQLAADLARMSIRAPGQDDDSVS